MSHDLTDSAYVGDFPLDLSLDHTEAPDGVTTGFVQVSDKQIRSWVDRLGKAARKDSPSAWMMVGRVQAELSRLLEKAE